MGKGDERAVQDREDETEMRESKSCAWLRVVVWVKELRDEEGEAACEWESWQMNREFRRYLYLGLGVF